MNTHGHTVEEWRAKRREYTRHFNARHPEARKLYRQRARQQRSEYNKRWYLANREAKLIATKRYQKANRVQLREAAKAWRHRNPEKTKIYARTKRARHGDVMRQRNRQRYHLNSKALNQQSTARRRLWPENRKEEQRAKNRKYQHSNLPKFLAAYNRRRARKMAAEVNPRQILEWMQAVKAKSAVVCYYCKQSVPTTNINFDHVVALARGGAHSISNLAVSCRHCNAAKHATPIHSWKRSGQQILSL